MEDALLVQVGADRGMAQEELVEATGRLNSLFIGPGRRCLPRAVGNTRRSSHAWRSSPWYPGPLPRPLSSSGGRGKPVAVSVGPPSHTHLLPPLWLSASSFPSTPLWAGAGVQRRVIEQPSPTSLSATSMVAVAKACAGPARSVMILASVAFESENTVCWAPVPLRALKVFSS